VRPFHIVPFTHSLPTSPWLLLSPLLILSNHQFYSALRPFRFWISYGSFVVIDPSRTAARVARASVDEPPRTRG
jgi:hypothetical protein